MSDPRTNTDIEDVLSSIRRLVSQGEQATAARPAAAAPGPERAASERLVLTPALRVVPARAEAQAPGDRASLEATIAELEAAVSGYTEEWEPDGSEVGQAQKQPGAASAPRMDDAPGLPHPEGDSFDFAPLPPLPPEDAAFPQPRRKETVRLFGRLIPANGNEPRQAPEFGRPAEPALPNDADMPPAASAGKPHLRSPAPRIEPGAQPEALAPAERATVEACEPEADQGSHAQTSAFQVRPPRLTLTLDTCRDDAVAETIGLPSETAGGAPEQTDTTPDTKGCGVPHAPVGSSFGTSVADDPAARPSTVAALTEPEAETAIQDNPGVAAVAATAEASAGFDEVLLHRLVAQIVREELQGELGARITGAVRRHVRAEIRRALAEHDLTDRR